MGTIKKFDEFVKESFNPEDYTFIVHTKEDDDNLIEICTQWLSKNMIDDFEYNEEDDGYSIIARNKSCLNKCMKELEKQDYEIEMW